MLAEAARMALSQPIPTAVTSLLVAAVCAVILATTGQTVAAETQVLSRIDLAGTRSIIVLDSGGNAGITIAAVDRIGLLSGVEWVIGLGPAQDATNAQIRGGQPAPVRALYGVLPATATSSPWDQAPGTALVGSEAMRVLGLAASVGGLAIEDRELSVVGFFKAEEPLAFLNRSALTAITQGGDTTIRSIHVLARRPTDIEPLSRAVLAVIDPLDPSSITVETSSDLAQLRAAVAGELGQYGRNLVTLILAMGLVLVGLSVYGSVNSHRRDFGRRRALGASRLTIVNLVVAQTWFAGVAGTSVGVVLGVLMIERSTGTFPDVRFPLAIAVLALLTAALAALPPAMLAAFRDPVRVLRVP